MAKKKVTNNWIWQGGLFSEPIDEWYGFIYLMVDKESGKQYIGEKSFYSFKTPKGKTNKKKIESDWVRYPSSNKELSARIKLSGDKRNEKFTFEILSLCKDKSVMHFEEAYWIFKMGCLTTDMWYNENVKINIMSSYKDYYERIKRSEDNK